MSKVRVTVTLDPELAAAASAAVDAGRAESVSAWVSEALVARARRDERLSVLRDLLDEYEATHGAITREEVAAQLRADRDAAADVRARVRTRRDAV